MVMSGLVGLGWVGLGHAVVERSILQPGLNLLVEVTGLQLKYAGHSWSFINSLNH